MNIPDNSLADGIAKSEVSSDTTQPPAGKPLPTSGMVRGPVADPGYLEGNRARGFLDICLRIIVGGAFVAAGALKVANPEKFALDVSNYRLLPAQMINLVAIFIPWIEITAGLFVLAGIWLRAAALVIASLTVVFFCIIVSALARGLNIECGCFGTVGGKHVGLMNLAIDTSLFLLAALLAWRTRARPANEIFSQAGARTSATPISALPKDSSTA